MIVGYAGAAPLAPWNFRGVGGGGWRGTCVLCGKWEMEEMWIYTQHPCPLFRSKGKEKESLLVGERGRGGEGSFMCGLWVEQECCRR